MTKTIRERDIERYLINQVNKLGGECNKVKWIGRRGAPDRLVMLPDRPVLGKWREVVSTKPAHGIWIELKAPGVPPEPHQLREHARMRKMGQRVEVVDSFAKVDEVLS